MERHVGCRLHTPSGKHHSSHILHHSAHSMPAQLGRAEKGLATCGLRTRACCNAEHQPAPRNRRVSYINSCLPAGLLVNETFAQEAEIKTGDIYVTQVAQRRFRLQIVATCRHGSSGNSSLAKDGARSRG